MTAPQRGMALIEALVASAVLGIGLLGATQLSLKAMQTAAETRQRHVAQMLAQEAMDCIRSGNLCDAQTPVEVQGIRYTREIRITPRSAQLQDVQVTVQWSSAIGLRQAPAARLDGYSSVAQLPNWVGR
jgi:type IV pilus modification protein PilV